ncbi:putative oligomerization/nucleic acid binding protein [Isoptericola sp. CG 20/1183]|uniref:Oligomerization/nucleic acid binding protein n=1 Tax=Isoptericola halotolerans TaxID=300560 RepID=A0ABX5EAI5_9MICO|nr:MULTISPECIES: SHOCT domain-containing protein [unclassified Isoptericola]MCK0118637.1 SHOCT domain-containing protein [Isoptericola sp. S6320L]PRZ03212.1 putative oligomerization/nucleic acid binding protein [Isoptericola sp. CG 20/1183]PRZ03576.1 putative oligomerization/nucleic acid binding protein [Isoptericola halotolerans]
MGLIRGMARTAVVAGTATAVSNRVSRRQAGRWAAQEDTAPPQPQYAPPPPQAAPAPVAAGGSDVIAQLERLGQLRDNGVLTDAEFAAQKARLLAG